MTKLILIGVKEKTKKEKSKWVSIPHQKRVIHLSDKVYYLYTSDNYIFEYNGKKAEINVQFMYNENDDELKFFGYYINYGFKKYPRWVNFKIKNNDIQNLLIKEMDHLKIDYVKKELRKIKIKEKMEKIFL
jgi:hypothetical protein